MMRSLELRDVEKGVSNFICALIRGDATARSNESGVLRILYFLVVSVHWFVMANSKQSKEEERVSKSLVQLHPVLNTVP
jgi:hypothetical protein